MGPTYDSLLIVSFGGPLGPADVLPFLENVLRGRNVPRERMLEVAEHYQHFGGVSPIDAQNRALMVALESELRRRGLSLPVYLGNRNWHPLLADTLRAMAVDGRRRALAFFTSALSSYSGCRQYRENVAEAQAEVGSVAPEIDKLRTFFNHPGFIEPMIERTQAALEQVPSERRAVAELVFTAHSIPMAQAAGCAYAEQFREAARLVADGAGRHSWRLAYQSRSGPPSQPWLEPDVVDELRLLRRNGARDAVVVPIGFISDHLEVIYDLDTEAQAACQEIGLNMVRAGTVGVHPRFVRMIAELVEERLKPGSPRHALGAMAAGHDECPADCCRVVPPLHGAR